MVEAGLHCDSGADKARLCPTQLHSLHAESLRVRGVIACSVPGECLREETLKPDHHHHEATETLPALIPALPAAREPHKQTPGGQ